MPISELVRMLVLNGILGNDTEQVEEISKMGVYFLQNF